MKRGVAGPAIWSKLDCLYPNLQRRNLPPAYADDHLLGFTGPKAEAEGIKQRLAQFLRDDLELELSQDKTLITHARTQAATFLGYQITVGHSRTRPRVNGTIRLRVPQTVINAKCAPYLKHGQPEHRAELMNRDDHAIISAYGAEYRGASSSTTC